MESVGRILARLAEAEPPDTKKRPAVAGRLPHPAIAGFVVASVIWVAALALGLMPVGVDAQTFYDHLDDPYRVTDYASGTGFYYAPPIALAMRLLTPFGPAIFGAIMVAIGLAALGWIGGKWAWALLFFPPVWWDISAGNVNTLIGAASIAMLVRPGWIAVPLLTKVTPGLIGLWWIVRGEWRPAVRAAVIVGGLCLVSLLIVPGWWTGWIGGLLSNGTGYTGPGYFTVGVPLLPRLALAVVVVVVGARKGWRWTLPIAACLALPVLWWSGLAILAAVKSSRSSGRAS